jgi:hypothetical protein
MNEMNRTATYGESVKTNPFVNESKLYVAGNLIKYRKFRAGTPGSRQIVLQLEAWSG